MTHYSELLKKQLELMEQNKRFAQVTVLSARSPSALKEGAKALVTEDGAVHGWLGGTCTTQEIVDACIDAMERGKDHVTRSFKTCQGGEVTVLIEVLNSNKRFLVVGDQRDLVDAVSTIAGAVGFHVTHIDVGSGDLDGVIRKLDQFLNSTAPTNLYALVATMGSNDQVLVEKILGVRPVYLGVVAGRRRAEAIRKWLEGRGVPEGLANRISAPAGLDIKAATPAEIALSVVAEAVAHSKSDMGGVGGVASGQRPHFDETYVDPVCGMLVDQSSEHYTLLDGKRVMFCSGGCKKMFDLNPQRYLPSIR
jgi:xanthine dehydrogenase accessory factor